jgi:hypothetical protein
MTHRRYITERSIQGVWAKMCKTDAGINGLIWDVTLTQSINTSIGLTTLRSHPLYWALGEISPVCHMILLTPLIRLSTTTNRGIGMVGKRQESIICRGPMTKLCCNKIQYMLCVYEPQFSFLRCVNNGNKIENLRYEPFNRFSDN